MKILYTLTLALMITVSGYSQNYKQVKIYFDVKQDIELLQIAGLELDHVLWGKDNSITVFLSDQQFARLQLTNFVYEVLIDDWFYYYSKQPKLSESEKASFIQNSKDNFGVEGFGYGSMGGFFTMAELYARLDSMYTLYPNIITQKFSIGTTIEGRPIYAVKISDNPNVNENEPQVFYNSLIHAREPQGMMTIMYYMYYLLENYGTDPEVTYLVNSREIYFQPLVNPDGYEYNRSTNANGGGMWRKNRRLNSDATRGVDLNRNFGFQWGYNNVGSSPTPSSETYRGTAPFSEPETQAMRDFVNSKNIKTALNYHTYSNLLLYPWGYISSPTPDNAIFVEFSNDMVAYNGYENGQPPLILYDVNGATDDWMYGDQLSKPKILSMTPEVGSTGFWPTQAEIFPLAIENLEPNLYYTWVAGEYISMINPNYSQQYFNPGDNVQMSPVFKNKGLSTGYNISVELSSLNAFATITNSSASFDSIQSRGTASVTSPLSFTVSPTAPSEAIIKLLLTTRTNGTVMKTDTLNILVGVPTYVFADTTNNPLTLWAITGTPAAAPKWAATVSTFNSAPNSYTDSPSGNYIASSTVTMTLTNPINLAGYTNPRLTYYTKYDIENDWDYGQVEISTNNGSSWIPLQGQYTNPGTGSFQPNGEPLYDGTRTEWVREEISLSSYISSQVKLRFELKTDGSVQKDGWYVDDIGIIYYSIVPVELTNFTATSGESSVLLKWTTSTETNNRGFEIEKNSLTGSSGQGWIKIGYIEGKGTTSETQQYKFTDKNPVTGKNIYRLKQFDYDGTYRTHGTVETDFSGVKDYALEQNYPNPFNPSTQIKYALPKSGYVSLKVYNLLGAEVASLVNEYKEAGRHSVELNASSEELNLSSGVYVYSIRVNDYVHTRKLVFMK